MSIPEHLIRDLPDAESVTQFARRFSENHPTQFRKLLANEALLSDVLTLVAYSPLLATTLLQNPGHISWLNRRRRDKGVRGKEELLESLARFALTNSQVDDQVVLARFRRRELLRIYLADIRRQLTIAEITEELSNLADAILEFSLRLARQELDNRFGGPLEIDEKGRERPARFCIVSLGKLGSRELNYSSDIDLLFLYSAEGHTSGAGSRGKVTDREYFIKLAELIAKLIGQQTGEGATYRVDLRLRPHGRVGPLAMSVSDTARYYNVEAAAWERQVLIRCRPSAGEQELFQDFYSRVEGSVFSAEQSAEQALRSVRLSKQKIDLQRDAGRGIDVKLGTGGIREIEFIAQALQLAYGGRDRWLRSSHTLISLSRLADRSHISDHELSELFEAYEFLRRLEHILQMENGLQTHLVPNDDVRRRLVAARMGFPDIEAFEERLSGQMSNVSRIFKRIFAASDLVPDIIKGTDGPIAGHEEIAAGSEPEPLAHDIVRSSPRLSLWLGPFPEVVQRAFDTHNEDPQPDHRRILTDAAFSEEDFSASLGSLRLAWKRELAEIIALDLAERIPIRECKRRQTSLAEASIDVAVALARREMERSYSIELPSLGIAVMGLGKLGGAGIDYESDLDLVLVFDEAGPEIVGTTPVEFYSRAAEVFITALSGMTREGNLYRVDLRLRPHGKNGPSVISRLSFGDYMRETAAIWELLAFVKLRAAGGEHGLANRVETEISRIVHSKAKDISDDDLRNETRRVRLLLEQQRGPKRKGEVNIKYGPGGMLDIYFAIRYLQLRDGVPDIPDNRSSDFMLRRLRELGSLTPTQAESLLTGYEFLSRLDHAMRLLIGRTHILPHPDHPLYPAITERTGLEAGTSLPEVLSLHRLNVREAFDSVTM